MRPLQHLPVWVVIRLCTDEDKMVDYWNNIDNEIELNMDVIDDPLGEAQEIYRYCVRASLLYSIVPFCYERVFTDLLYRDMIRCDKIYCDMMCCDMMLYDTI